jgi:hypothetical protein
VSFEVLTAVLLSCVVAWLAKQFTILFPDILLYNISLNIATCFDPLWDLKFCNNNFHYTRIHDTTNAYLVTGWLFTPFYCVPGFLVSFFEVWLPDNDTIRDRNMQACLMRYCNIKHLERIKCILLVWVLWFDYRQCTDWTVQSPRLFGLWTRRQQYPSKRGHAVAQLVEVLRYKPEGRGFDWRWNFSLTLSFRPHYGLGVDSASNRNEYQEYFLGR